MRPLTPEHWGTSLLSGWYSLDIKEQGLDRKGSELERPQPDSARDALCHTLLPGLGGWPLTTAQHSSKGHPLRACVFSPSRDQCWPPPGPRAHPLAAQATCQDSKALVGHLLERPQTEAGGSPDPAPCSLTGVCARTWEGGGCAQGLSPHGPACVLSLGLSSHRCITKAKVPRPGTHTPRLGQRLTKFSVSEALGAPWAQPRGGPETGKHINVAS